MATNQLDNLTLGGTITMDTNALFARVVCGAGIPGHATGAGSCYVKGTFEVDGATFIDGDMTIDGGGVVYIEDNNAAAVAFQESTNVYLKFDTTDAAEQVEVGKLLELSTSGWINYGTAAGAMRQPEMFTYALSAGDAGGGILNQLNPMGAAGFVKIMVTLSASSTGACTADAGVAATGVSDDTLMDGIDINAGTGPFSSDDSSNSGTPWAAIAAGEYITISMATGAAAGTAGTAFVWFMKTP
jgi:hypothetical protein